MAIRQTRKLSIRGNKGCASNGNWGRIPLEKSETTIAKMLQGAGYQTVMVGK